MRYRYRLSAILHAHFKAPHAISPDAMRNRRSAIGGNLYTVLKHPNPFTPMRWNIAIGNRHYPMHNNKAPRSYPRCDAISQSAIGDTLFMHIVMPIHPDAMRFRYRRSVVCYPYVYIIPILPMRCDITIGDQGFKIVNIRI